jgi:hypothetical protein
MKQYILGKRRKREQENKIILRKRDRERKVNHDKG